MLRHLAQAGVPPVESFELRAEFRGLDGSVLAVKTWRSPAGRELAFDSEELLGPRAERLEGSVLLEVERVRLREPHPAGKPLPGEFDLNGILLYSSPGRYVTGTHLYQGVGRTSDAQAAKHCLKSAAKRLLYGAAELLRAPSSLWRSRPWTRDAIGASVVRGGAGEGRGFVVLHNDHPAPAACGFLETRSEDGKVRRESLPRMAAGQTLARELPVEGWNELVCALPPAGVARLLTGERFEDGAFSVDHDYFQQPEGTRAFDLAKDVRWFDRASLRDGVIGPSHPWPLIHDARTETLISLCNQFHPHAEKLYDLRVYDNDGRLALERRGFVRLPPYGLRVASVSAELRAEGVEKLEGTYLITHSPDSPSARLPSRLHAQGLYRFDGRYWNGVQSDASIWSSPEPAVPEMEALSSAKVRRRQVWFAPVLDSPDIETVLAVSNLSYSLRYDKAQTLGVRYCEGDRTLGEAEITLKPFGAALIPARELFGAVMPPAEGGVRTGCAVFYPKTGITYCASVMYRDRRSGLFFLEHVLPLPKFPHER